MIRWIASTILYVVGNAIGIVVAASILPGFTINLMSIVIVAVVFTVIVTVSTPFLIKISTKNVPQMNGGIALIAILVGLIGTNLLSDGLTITGVETWIMAPLVIWVTALVAGLVLPLVFFKKTLEKTEES